MKLKTEIIGTGVLLKLILILVSIISHAQEFCPEPVDLRTHEIIHDRRFVHFNSTRNIQASNNITGQSHVSYISGQAITFKPGFSVRYDAKMRAGITTCENEKIMASLPAGPYGGGRGYSALINTDGFYAVRSWNEFKKAVEVDGHTKILIDKPFEIGEDVIIIKKPNTIIAGLRGQLANNPSKMEQKEYRPNRRYGKIRVHKTAENLRITGVELIGFWKSFEGVYDYDESSDFYNLTSSGIAISNVKNIEIDNCYFSHWNGSAISVTQGENINIHHNVFMKNNSPQWPRNSNGEIIGSMGYGISVSGFSKSPVTVTFNLFENNKHAIAGGVDRNSYIAMFNAVRHDIEDYRHAFDMHGCMDREDQRNSGGCFWPNWNYSGNKIVIYNNFFEEGNNNQGAIGIRGVPYTAGYIRNNYFETNSSPQRVVQNLGDLDSDGVVRWDGNEMRHEETGNLANLYLKDNKSNININYLYTSFGNESSDFAFWKIIRPFVWDKNQIGVADFDGDGIDDLIRTEYGKWYVSKNGSSPWKQWGDSNLTASNIILGDFTGDGRADILSTSSGIWRIARAKASGDGFAGFTSFGNIGLADINNTIIGDFNNDGLQDLLKSEPGVNGQRGRWLCAYSNGFNFNNWMEIGISNFMTRDMGVGDFDGNGFTDIFINDNGFWTVNYRGKNTWSGWVQVGKSQYKPSELLFGDFDGDGDTDIFKSDTGNWYVSFSEGTSQSFTGWGNPIGKSNFAFRDLFIGNFDGDLIQDINVIASDISSFDETGNRSRTTYGNKKEISLVANTNNIESNMTLNIFPNPSKGIFNIVLSLPSSREHVYANIYDMAGRIIKTKHYINIKYINEAFDVSALNHGVYLLKIEFDNEVLVKRIIIN